MKRYLAIVAIVASLLVGCAAPATSGPANLAEDDPGWNCLTMGNHECGPDMNPWDSFTVESLPADVVSAGFRAEYVGLYAPDTLPNSLVGMPAKHDASVVYGFKIESTK